MNRESDKYGMTDLEFSMLKGLIYDEAFSGDQSFGEFMLNYLYRKLERLGPPDQLDLDALLEIIDRIAGSKQAINVICGTEGKQGKAKKGFDSLKTAMDVYDNHRLKKLTAEEAWAKTADDLGIPFDTVKKHWMKWKNDIDMAVIRSVEASEQASPKDQ